MLTSRRNALSGILWLRTLLLPFVLVVLWAVALWGLYQLGFGHPSGDARTLRPYPDNTEYVWQALSFSQASLPLQPIGHELHPSRYAPVHPLLLGAFIRAFGQREAVYWWPPAAFLTGSLFFYLALGEMGVGTIA